MKLTNGALVQGEQALQEIADMELPGPALWRVFDLVGAVSEALRPYRQSLSKLLERHTVERDGRPLPLVRQDGTLILEHAADPVALSRDLEGLLGIEVEVDVQPLTRELFADASSLRGRVRPFQVLQAVGLFQAGAPTPAGRL